MCWPGGANDGLSLLQLLPGGRLLHRASFADTTTTALANVTSLSATVINGVIEIFATSETEAGVTHLQFDPGPSGSMMLADAWGDVLSGGALADVLAGGAGDDDIRGNAGDDIILDGGGADRLWGGTGADIFVFSRDGAVDRIMDFELGIDRIDLSDLGRVYSVSALDLQQTANGITISFGSEVLEVVSLNGAPINPNALSTAMLFDLWHVPVSSAPEPRLEAARTIEGSSGVDRLYGSLAVDAEFDLIAAQVYRLYHSTRDREPDSGGFSNWVNWLAQGNDLTEAAARFVASAEFQLRYGDPDDETFVTLLYNNVLDREPDSGGFAHWTNILSTALLTRAEVVTRFSESQEFRNNTDADVIEYMRALGTDDRIIGDAGNDLLFGGWRSDVFVFNTAQPGDNKIADLEPWDRIALDGFGWGERAATVFDTIMDNMSQGADGAVFSAQGVTITFLDRALSDITADMFWLG